MVFDISIDEGDLHLRFSGCQQDIFGGFEEQGGYEEGVRSGIEQGHRLYFKLIGAGWAMKKQFDIHTVVPCGIGGLLDP